MCLKMSSAQQTSGESSDDEPQEPGVLGGASTSTVSSSTTTQPAFNDASHPQQNNSILKPAILRISGKSTEKSLRTLSDQPIVPTNGKGFDTLGKTAVNTTNFSPTSDFKLSDNAAIATNPGTSTTKYLAKTDTETIMKEGRPNNINTKQQCITAMKEYEGKSLEELRMEDYLANRKGPQPGCVDFKTAAQSCTGCWTGLSGQSSDRKNIGLFTSTSVFTQPKTKPFEGAATNPSGYIPAFENPAASLFRQHTASTYKPTYNPSGTVPAFKSPDIALFPQNTASTFKTSPSNAGFRIFNTETCKATGEKLSTGVYPAPPFEATSQSNACFKNFSFNNRNINNEGLFNSNLDTLRTSGLETNIRKAVPENSNTVNAQKRFFVFLYLIHIALVIITVYLFLPSNFNIGCALASVFIILYLFHSLLLVIILYLLTVIISPSANLFNIKKNQ